MSRTVTPRTSLEALKKEAKRWLKALRSNNSEARARLLSSHPTAPAEPGLRDVQHALALEYGFAGWVELTSRIADPTPPHNHQYQAMADALLDAYLTGTPAAMERYWSHTWHRRNWQAMRTYVQLDLGRQLSTESEAGRITLDDARFLVAREHGFESWQALIEYSTALPTSRGGVAAKPVSLMSMDESGTTHRMASLREWDAVIDMMREKQIPALNAEGQMTDDVLERMSHLDHVTSLNLGGSKQLTDAGVRHLSRMPGLRHLDLSGTAVTDQSLGVLSQLKALREINLSWTAVTDSGISNLNCCDKLERVELMGTSTGDGAIRAMEGKRNLRHLRTGNGVTDAGLPLLHEIPVFRTWHGGEPTMGLLEFEAGPNCLLLRGTFTDAGIARLTGLDGLFALNIDDRSLAVTPACLTSLAALPKLGWLAFDAGDDAMSAIASMPHLRFLMCQDTTAGDDGFAALSRSQSIEYLWGRRCYNLKSRGFAALSKMPALRHLSVSCKNVDDVGLSALPQFPALRELMPMDIPDEGYRHIARCADLESLVLMYCRETGDAATEHISGLRKLKNYFASYTQITDRTPEILSSIASLEQVEFAGCAGLTNEGIAKLARLPRLRQLSVGGISGVTSGVVSAFPASVNLEVSV